MKSVAEIEQLLTDFERRHQDLATRMDGDYQLWELKNKTWLDKWSTNVTFNEPRTYADSIFQTLGGARRSIKVKREDKDEKKDALMEHLLASAFTMADESLVNRITSGTLLQSSLLWYGGIRGFVAGRVVVRKIEDKVDVEILPYDPHPNFLAYGTNGRGIIWSVYKTWRDRNSAELEYKKNFKPQPIEDNYETEAKILDSWDTTHNIVTVGDEIAQSPKHKLGRPPVIVVPCGTTPLVVTSDGKYLSIKNWGESIYAGSRDLYPIQNKALSIWMTLYEKAHQPSYWVFDDALQGKVQHTPWGRGEAIALSSDAKVQMVELPDITRSGQALYEIISEAIQRANFSYLRYGQTKGKEYPSGRAYGMMMQGAETTMNPLLLAISTFYKMASRKIIEQYLYTGVKWEINGYDSKGREYHDVIKTEDIEGNYDIDVEFVAISKEQEAENYAKAQMAKQSRLAPDKFIYDKLIQFQDPAGVEKDMVLQEAGELSPVVKIMRAIDVLEKEGRVDEVNALKMQMGALMQQIIMQAGPQGQPQGAPQGAPPPQGMPPPATEEEAVSRLEQTVGGQ